MPSTYARPQSFQSISFLRRLRTTRLIAAVAVVAGAPFTFGQSIGSNLIVNGDAESGVASPDAGITLTPVVGWTTTDKFAIVTYGSLAWPSNSDPGPANRGNNFFVGGRPSALSTASQSVNISLWASTIDMAGESYKLSGWLGGWDGQDDNAVLTASFVGSSGVISTATIGPVTEADRSGVTGLFYRETSGIIPTGTRSVDFLLTMTRLQGSDNDGYADNLSFVVTPVPENSGTSLAVGLSVLCIAMFRRARQNCRT